MKIILIGYMGSGKSLVGMALADKIGLKFYDLDNEISMLEKKKIPEIFKDSGEIYFRRKEHELLKEFLNSENDFVLSLGGGTPCFGSNMELIRQTPETKSVYLKTSVGELTRRLMKEKDGRPVIRHLKTEAELEDFIRKHLFERGYYYNQADIIISTDSKGVEELTAEITQRSK